MKEEERRKKFRGTKKTILMNIGVNFVSLYNTTIERGINRYSNREAIRRKAFFVDRRVLYVAQFDSSSSSRASEKT